MNCMKKCHESKLQSKLKNPDFNAIANYEVVPELSENYLQRCYPKLQSGQISRNFDEIVEASNTLLIENCLKISSKGQFGESQKLERPEPGSRKTPGGPVRGDLGHPRRLIIRRSARRVVPEVHQPCFIAIF
jgi:hypothetical protein